MPRLVPSDQLDEIAGVVAAHPGGLGRDAISRALSTPLDPRTLQRRLRQLVQTGRVVARHEHRLVRYLAPAPAGAEPASPSIVAAGAEPATSYDPTLLASYRFQRTRIPYLDADQRGRLHALAAEWRTAARRVSATPPDALLVDCAWGLARLDGNVSSRAQFGRLIEAGTPSPHIDPIQCQDALNHLNAMRYALHAAERHDIERATTLEVHALLSDGLLDEPAESGRVREGDLAVAGSKYRPLASRQRLEELLDASLSVARGISDPFEQAFFLLVQLSYLQPFAIANEAVARLIANVVLLRHGLCPVSFIGTPRALYRKALLDLCEFKRIEPLRELFIRAFESACRSATAHPPRAIAQAAFRMRHRAALADAIRALVRGSVRANEDAVRQAIPESVAPDDRDRFAALMLTELHALHSGNAVRFALQPDELQRWKELQ